jgi:cytochrome c oxidase subunit 1
LFAAGFLDMVRRGSVYPSNLETLNQFVSASAFCLGISMLVFLWNLVQSLVFTRVPAEQNPWHSRGLEWQVPTPVPLYNFDEIPEITGDPYDYGVPGAAPVARLGPATAPARAK